MKWVKRRTYNIFMNIGIKHFIAYFIISLSKTLLLCIIILSVFRSKCICGLRFLNNNMIAWYTIFI